MNFQISLEELLRIPEQCRNVWNRKSRAHDRCGRIFPSKIKKVMRAVFIIEGIVPIHSCKILRSLTKATCDHEQSRKAQNKMAHHRNPRSDRKTVTQNTFNALLLAL